MSDNSKKSRGSSKTTTIVEDVFLTDAFLIKGRLPKKGKRLTNVLEDHNRAYLEIQDATMVSLRSGEVITTPRVMINMSEVILAHELVDVAGDEYLRRLALPNKTVHIRAFYSGAVQFELAGNVEPGAYEVHQGHGRRYFIMKDPVVRGIETDASELSILRSLDYAIVRKEKMAYVYDFS